jgi:hypothetical protein
MISRFPYPLEKGREGNTREMPFYPQPLREVVGYPTTSHAGMRADGRNFRAGKSCCFAPPRPRRLPGNLTPPLGRKRLGPGGTTGPGVKGASDQTPTGRMELSTVDGSV